MEKVKYFTADMQEVVTLGDTIHMHEKEQTEFGTLIKEEVVKVTEDSLPYLIKKGVLITKDSISKKSQDAFLIKIINKFANHLDCEYKEAIDFLETVYTINSTAFYNMVFKKIAIEFDKAYPDHISKAKDLWFISTMTLEVLPMRSRKNINFKNFAAFRTPDEAHKAVMLANIIADHFDEQ